MKIVVIGGTGLIGSKLVKKLREHGHETIAASPDSGVNTLTGEGLAKAMQGASVIVDVSNSPSWEDAAVLKFFETSTRNLLTFEAAAGVGHHVALSVVGTDRLSESGYFRAKIAQEKLIKESSIPYSIVRATQFFEFLKSMADSATEGNEVRIPPVAIQPMAADDVASALYAGERLRKLHFLMTDDKPRHPAEDGCRVGCAVSRKARLKNEEACWLSMATQPRAAERGEPRRGYGPASS